MSGGRIEGRGPGSVASVIENKPGNSLVWQEVHT